MTSKHFRTAATLSWAMFIFVIAANVTLRSAGFRTVSDLVCLALLLAGFALGIIALLGVTRHGRQGILIPSIVGLVLNGLFLFVWATNFLAAIQRSQGQP